jgi:hypothetical protein
MPAMPLLRQPKARTFCFERIDASVEGYFNLSLFKAMLKVRWN